MTDWEGKTPTADELVDAPDRRHSGLPQAPPSPPSGVTLVEDGQGSTIARLLDESGEGSASPEERRIKTGLLLTGRELTTEDHRRIRDAVRLARSAR